MKKKNRIYPSRNPPAIVNPVYNTSSSSRERQTSFHNNRQLPPITNARSYKNEIYHRVNEDRYNHLSRGQINERTHNVNYSVLNRDIQSNLATTYRYPPSN